MHRKPRNVSPLGELVILVALLIATLVIQRCTPPMRPSTATVPMPTTSQGSTDPAAVRS